MSLPLVASCSRRAFSARPPLRVVEHDSPHHFKPLSSIPREKLAECPALADLTTIDPIWYLSEYMGLPGLVKGVSHYGSGMTVFSENMKHMAVVCRSRVADNKIKFNHGSEEFKERREDCWEFCVKRERIEVITKQFRSNPIEYPLVIHRPDELNCPICDDLLTGQNMSCDNKHQICLTCFDLLPGIGGQKKCPMCNTQTYSQDHITKYELMKGKLIKEDPYFYLDLSSGRNSFYDFAYKEAQFFGMIKYLGRHTDFNIFDQMLLSSLYNFYTLHKEAFTSYNFNLLDQVDYNNRTLNPFSDDVNPVLEDFIGAIRSHGIYQDIAYTSIFVYGYDDIDFYRDLEYVEGNVLRVKDYPNGSKETLRREIYFRAKVKRATSVEIKAHLLKIFQTIAKNSNRYNSIFNSTTQNINMT